MFETFALGGRAVLVADAEDEEDDEDSLPSCCWDVAICCSGALLGSALIALLSSEWRSLNFLMFPLCAARKRKPEAVISAVRW